jgi:hypothetical protein
MDANMIQDAGWKGGQHLMARAYSLVCGRHFFEHEGISFKKSPCRQWEWHRSLVSFCAAAIYAVMSAMGQKQT